MIRTVAFRFLSVAAAMLACAAAAWADPPVWRVDEPGGAKITLFGSVHLLSGATRWRTPALDADLAHAQAIWFEIPIDPAAQGQAGALALQKGVLPTAQTLSAVLPPNLYARAAALAAREGLPEASLQRLRPWMAELTLSLLYFQKQGASADLGVEQQLAAAAPPAAERDAFETVAEQIDLFADDPLPQQVASLKETLDEIDADPGVFDRLARAWAAGDVRALAHEALDPVRQEDPALYDRLILARNRRFAARITELARQGRDVMVVVGAGHLVGPDGVPNLLRRAGLRVEGP